MSYRLDALEKNHNDLLVELRTKVLRPVEPPPYEAPKTHVSAQAAPQPLPQQSPFEPPPYAEPPPPVADDART